MEKIIVEKPRLPKGLQKEKLISKLFSTEDFMPFFLKATEEKYLYWDKFQYLTPLPNKTTAVEAWLMTKAMRKLRTRPSPVSAQGGDIFRWIKLDKFDELLNNIDVHAGGRFTKYESISNQSKQKYISRGIIEESIASSQMEGANTTRKAAKKLILENRKPRNESELMIINNYKTMLLLEKEYQGLPLSKKLLLAMHESLVKGDLCKEEAGRFRKDTDKIYVRDDMQIAYIPPKEKFFHKELDKLIAYANDEDTNERFTHPVIKAIILHFWIAYLHPFTDGNGRLARAIFYWYLLRKEYWTIMYLPISAAIKNSRTQYDWAYIYSEQDDNDLTYFIEYNLRKIIDSINKFNEYLDKVDQENNEIDALVSQKVILNERQKQLLHYLLESKNQYTSIKAYSTSNNISRLTAKKDLEQMVSQKVLFSKKYGKYLQYYLEAELKKG